MATVNRNTQIDPTFFLPPNVIDLRYEDDEDVNRDDAVDPDSSETVESTPLDSGPEVSPTDDILPETTALLPAPDNLTIVSQSVRSPAGGNYVVDVVIEIPDMAGVETFDVQVAKA